MDHQAMNALYCNNTQYGFWSKSQSANRDGAILLFEDDLVGSQSVAAR
jgi:hypothetical protein